MKRSQYIRPLIAGLTLVMASGTVLAQNTATGNAQAESGKPRQAECNQMGKGQGGKHNRGEQQRGHSMKMQLPDQVMQDLKLSGDQMGKYEQARSIMANARQAMQEAKKQRKQQATGEQNTNFDPRAMFERQNARFEQGQAMRQQVQQAWLGFWDSLDTQQKSVLQAYMKSKKDQRGEQRGQQGKHNGGHRHG